MAEWKRGFDEVNKIWRGAENDRRLYAFGCSIGEIIFHNLRNYAKNVVQIAYEDNKAVTNREALLWGISLATYFQKKLQLTHEDIVGIVATNTTHVLAVELGCFFNATPFHAVNPTIPEVELKHILGLTQPKIVFCDGEDYEKVARATSHFKPLICTFTTYKNVAKVDDLFQLVPPEIIYSYEPVGLVEGGNQTVAIICSSGTTGMPKAVSLSNYRLVQDMGFLTNDDVVYCNSGLDWASGLLTSLLPYTNGCTRIISREGFSVDHFSALVQHYKVTLTMLAPFHVTALINAPSENAKRLRSLRCVVLIGGAMSPNALKSLQQLLPEVYFRVGWGFTEFGGATATLADTLNNHAGKLLPGISACVVDELSGQRVGPNEIGEIYVKDGHIWNGYYNDVKETQAMQDEVNWFRSGDLGYFDEQQVLHIFGRKKEICKYRGFHYWPKEIEDVIEELPAVLAACVVGLEDENNGDAAAAAVVKRPNHSLAEDEVKAHVAMRVAATYKQLHGGVWFFEEGTLPYSRNGKKLRRETKLLIKEKIKLA